MTGNVVEPQAEDARLAQLRHLHRPDRRGALVYNIGVTAVDVGGSVGLYFLVTALGGGIALAYAISCIGPLIGALIVWARTRTLNLTSILVLVIVIANGIAAVLTQADTGLLAIENSIVPLLIGFAFLGSFLLPHPIAFGLGQRFATDGTAEAMTMYNDLWDRYPQFRMLVRAANWIWAIAFLVEGTVIVIAFLLLPLHTAGTINQLLPIATILVAFALTYRTGAAAQKNGLWTPPEPKHIQSQSMN